MIKDKNPLSISYDPFWKKLWDKRFSNPLSDAETFKITKNNVEKVESLIKEHADFMKKIIVLMEVKFSWFIIMYQNQKSL